MAPLQVPRTARFGVGSRLAIAIPAYVARVLVLGWTPSSPLLALAVDSLVVVLCIWALVPGRDQFGPSFAKRTHWTGIFMIPLLLAILLAIRDFALLARALGA
jgi:hypothetical protein